jgi:NAD-dependent dihydropyrimidine dehydrogenase PreA subunit
MFHSKKTLSTRKNHSDCSGCSLCLLVCPVWRQTRDIGLTPHGHAKALQHNAATVDSASAWHCTLCMACEPACPDNIDIIGMILEFRRQQSSPHWLPDLRKKISEETTRQTVKASSSARAHLELPVLLPDASLHAHPDTLARTAGLLDARFCDDDGSDISLALESGADIPEQRLHQFLAPLRPLNKIIVADGLLFHYLKKWIPNLKAISLGEAISSHAAVRRSLRRTDLYIIEPRAYHSDYPHLVKYYDSLRIDAGCMFNLDLQRIAIPATVCSLPQRLGFLASNDEEQTRWLMHRQNITRIVVESLADYSALKKNSGFPVVHLADLPKIEP